ncbi:MAG: hypothetical protein JXB49_13505 [Bacteroidales bacterium]|nr:hypothetical protein [Bacteroidales bacterium]
MDVDYVIRPEYQSPMKIYDIVPPAIETGDTYFFYTDSGLRYEVRFGKRKDNYLGNILNFSVLDDEFEDEYSETNKGEVFRVIATVIEIVRLYHEKHNYSNHYEFSGEYKDIKDDDESSIRTKMFFRTAKKVVSPHWNIKMIGNKVIISK